MPTIHTIDLQFLETSEAIACFLIETSVGPILIETGPESTFPQLQQGIEQLGFQVSDIAHVFLSHIHFDHAGAAWKFAALGAKIHVHPLGLPHLASPEKLWNSAAMIYGKEMERLWGSMQAIPEENLVSVGDGQTFVVGNLTLEGLHTPGHAVHHIAWKIDSIIFTGDVAGVKIDNGPVVPPCPPPDIHIEDWKNSIGKILEHRPTQLYLTHFGVIDQPIKHMEALTLVLDDWAQWMKEHFENQTPSDEVTKLFMRYTRKQLEVKNCSDALIQVYEYANPSWMSVAGLLRYWKLKSQGRI
ncbi:MBL fold metallo-hydrolase [Mongoliitalea daihaiensis]|uniref:MBL fold metallo-hydrolase n=1 Tax=Mongoliitalea daihaiensis TaxID=2782006 RepID=UPI001F39FA8D|nr:MBL fold metallo-hydrolase [Mongoliitalea daihaiensis]UJP63266.1 MBL fold metallo-hydrolase [Mongoliitalea daihaiensis]